jgi:hypothetical protein
MVIHASIDVKRQLPVIQSTAGIVGKFNLTDLCLFTDARYTRHPSMADLHTAFQDHPMSFEHFPSGALLSPPPHLGHHALVR